MKTPLTSRNTGLSKGFGQKFDPDLLLFEGARSKIRGVERNGKIEVQLIVFKYKEKILLFKYFFNFIKSLIKLKI